MHRIRALAPVVLACCTAILSLAASAQTEPTVGKRQKVDVRAMAPGPQASDAASPSPAASGLTRDQRKEATLQARQEGTLRPTGEAADPREAAPPYLPGAVSAPSPMPAAPAELEGAATPSTQLAAATASPVKKGKSKKPRPPGASAPA